MKRVSERTITIGSWLVCALVNADKSGLTEDDLKTYNEACEDIGLDTIDIVEDNSHFTKCHYSGLYGDCYTVNLINFR